ncbi:MAG: ligand-binding protein SH3 [Candidatus Omnitrophota bacterium]|nr:MAG: ligand-binding protein SH3 [Candidatus Omnitrophota bacterium]
MLTLIIHWLRGIPKEWAVAIIAGLPVSELRGAIPLALCWGMPFSKAFWLSVAGNALPVVPLLILLDPISSKLRKFKFWAKFFDWLFERTRKKADRIQKYEALGLALFVAIPLPMTGAWTGAVAASLFKIRFRYAFPAIIAGILIAGLLVSVMCKVGALSWKAVMG